MSDQSARFEFSQLYQALDAQRSQRDLKWSAVAAEIELPLSTIKATQRAKTMEADGVLAMVRWLQVPPEEFVRPQRAGRLRTDLPAGAMWRVDTAKLHAHLLAAKEARGQGWKEIAADIGPGITPASLTQLAEGGRISINLLAALAAWLDEPIDTFTRVTKE
jgi:hypothetical protein